METLLVADDDPLVQVTVKCLLEEAGYRVGLASNGREALAYLKANRVDTILLDVFMPEMDGLETLIEIRKQYSDLRIVMMSGGGTSSRFDFLTAAEKFGADHILKKPMSLSDLHKVFQAPPHTSRS